MSDGSLIALSPTPQARTPALAEALAQLIACAEQDALLHDIRALRRDHGLLIRGGGEVG